VDGDNLARFFIGSFPADDVDRYSISIRNSQIQDFSESFVCRCNRLNTFSADMTRINEKEAGPLRPASFVIHFYPLF
jgi:hypothetical protein